jgi:ribonuclease BN (tRNA processing enzyme)
MQLRVLGCSGGIGAQARTTCLLVGDEILLDAGTGIEDLSVEELARINHVFLTHSHLDHIAALPLMIDSVGSLRSQPLVIHALPATIEALKQHIFNWVIWPDFTEIPHFDRPWMRFEPISLGQSVSINQATIRALPASHTVPALAYQVSHATGTLVFTGDTGPNDELWQQVNALSDLKVLIIETAFSNREADLAVTAKHLFPIQLADELSKLQRETKVFITHLKPSDRQRIEQEVQAWAGRFSPVVLRGGELIEF